MTEAPKIVATQRHWFVEIGTCDGGGIGRWETTDSSVEVASKEAAEALRDKWISEGKLQETAWGELLPAGRSYGLFRIRSEDRVVELLPALAAAPEVQALIAAAREEGRRAATVDPLEIERAGKRWHGEDHWVIAVRYEPYKPDGVRQMGTKGRWQEMIGSGDYWRWSNCDRPTDLRETPTETKDPRT